MHVPARSQVQGSIIGISHPRAMVNSVMNPILEEQRWRMTIQERSQIEWQCPKQVAEL